MLDREAIVACRVGSGEDVRCICFWSEKLRSRSHGLVVTHFARKDKLEVEALPVYLLRVVLL